MKTQQILIGTLVAGVAMFLLGWLVYGMLIGNFLQANCNHAINRAENEMVMWAIALSNFIWAFLLTLIINWSKSRDLMSGAKVGAIAGFLSCLGFDLTMYSMTTMYNNFSVLLVDSAAYALLSAVAGALVARIAAGKAATTS